MKTEELTNFIEIWESLWEMYRPPNSPAKPSDIMIKMTFAALSEYSLEQVNHAVMKHIQSEKWMPKPADIIKHIEGGALTADEVIAEARLKRTPFGVMAAIHIGSYDLTHQDSFYLKQRAQEVISQLHPLNLFNFRLLPTPKKDFKIAWKHKLQQVLEVLRIL